MRPSLRRPRANRVAPLLCAVAALSLFALPVQYRGGADVAHPHAVFQLWLDAADGSTNHHGPAATEREHAADDGHPDAPARSVLAVEESPDTPRLSEARPAVEGFALVLTGAALLMALLLVRSTAAWSASPVWSGRLPNPETPPPRPAIGPV